MSQQVLAILLGFVLYLLYVLVPLIPSILIYRIFPDTKVGASGLLGSLKINATGAFAAYLITVVVGYNIIFKVQDQIFLLSSENSSWVVKSKVVFERMDDNGNWVVDNNIKDEDVAKFLVISAVPNYTQKRLSEVTFIAHELPQITFIYPGYKMEHSIDLADQDEQFDYRNGRINLGSLILRKDNSDYNPGAFNQINPELPPDTVILFGTPPTTSTDTTLFNPDP